VGGWLTPRYLSAHRDEAISGSLRGEGGGAVVLCAAIVAAAMAWSLAAGELQAP